MWFLDIAQPIIVYSSKIHLVRRDLESVLCSDGGVSEKIINSALGAPNGHIWNYK